MEKRKNYPISSELKGTGRIQRGPIGESSWAWMKLLREQNKTKRIYERNPYVEVYRFRENLYAFFTQSVDGNGDPWMYLIDGPHKAMLIDTGFGLGDLKGLCDEITGNKPLIVVNTHNHMDHAYGNFQFDRVYCHELEVPYLEMQDAHIWDYLFDENGKGKWLEFDRNDMVSFRKYEIVGVPDGYIFDLGDGYEVELVLLCGHTPGQSGFLDKKNRILFAGDDLTSERVNIGGRKNTPNCEYATVAAFSAQIKKLAARLDEFDYVFPGHFICDLESSVVTNMLAACEYVMEDPENNWDYKEEPPEWGVSYCKYVNGLGTLVYKPHSIGTKQIYEKLLGTENKEDIV